MRYTQLEKAIKELTKINDGILNAKAQYQGNNATIHHLKWLEEKGYAEVGKYSNVIDTHKASNEAQLLKLEALAPEFEEAIQKVMDLRNKG